MTKELIQRKYQLMFEKARLQANEKLLNAEVLFHKTQAKVSEEFQKETESLQKQMDLELGSFPEEEKPERNPAPVKEKAGKDTPPYLDELEKAPKIK